MGDLMWISRVSTIDIRIFISYPSQAQPSFFIHIFFVLDCVVKSRRIQMFRSLPCSLLSRQGCAHLSCDDSRFQETELRQSRALKLASNWQKRVLGVPGWSTVESWNFETTLSQSCIKFKKFRSRSAHHNDLREKIKIKFTGISELDLSFQFTMIWCELKFMVRSRVVQCPLLKEEKKNAKALSTPSFQ